MDFTAIPTSGIKILSVLRNAEGLSIPAIASGSLVSPGKVRAVVPELETRGWVKVDSDENFVRITPQGIELLQFVAKSPARAAVVTQPPHSKSLRAENLDLDAALDEAVSKLQT